MLDLGISIGYFNDKKSKFKICLFFCTFEIPFLNPRETKSDGKRKRKKPKFLRRNHSKQP